MAGTYLKNQVEYLKLRSWLDQALPQRGADCPQSEHVSEFCAVQLSGKQLLDFSIDAFLETVELLVEKRLARDIKPSLSISLGCSDDLVLWDDSLSIVEQMDEWEPPEIYLVEREKLKYLWSGELYKVSITLEYPQIQNKNYDIFYSCGRTRQHMEEGCEFGKYITVEYYPDSLLFKGNSS